MGQFFESISDEQAKLIQESHLFFIASADDSKKLAQEGAGPINLSPKGATPLHIIDRNTVAYLDYPGSGNQTAVHIEQNSPITIMVMSFSVEDAAIVRLFGYGKVYALDEYKGSSRVLEQSSEHLSKPRQVIEISVERTQTSCGYGVPVYEYLCERSKDARGRAFKA